MTERHFTHHPILEPFDHHQRLSAVVNREGVGAVPRGLPPDHYRWAVVAAFNFGVRLDRGMRSRCSRLVGQPQPLTQVAARCQHVRLHLWQRPARHHILKRRMPRH